MTVLLFFISLLNFMPTAQVWKCQNGKIEFNSNAPLELISAKSSELRAVIDPANGNFAFSVRNASFRGFNSVLQEEHFHESYMESHRYETSSFMGKIIEKIDFTKNGSFTIRAKGKLKVHGIERERIIQSTVQVNGQKMSVKSSFTVPLVEHNISIPKLVHQKIAEEIQITINAEFVFQ
jgi:hypothetical protein